MSPCTLGGPTPVAARGQLPFVYQYEKVSWDLLPTLISALRLASTFGSTRDWIVVRESSLAVVVPAPGRMPEAVLGEKGDGRLEVYLCIQTHAASLPAEMPAVESSWSL